jgi:DNA-binding transcriptional MerR regulator
MTNKFVPLTSEERKDIVKKMAAFGAHQIAMEEFVSENENISITDYCSKIIRLGIIGALSSQGLHYEKITQIMGTQDEEVQDKLITIGTTYLCSLVMVKQYIAESGDDDTILPEALRLLNRFDTSSQLAEEQMKEREVAKDEAIVKAFMEEVDKFNRNAEKFNSNNVNPETPPKPKKKRTK